MYNMQCWMFELTVTVQQCVDPLSPNVTGAGKRRRGKDNNKEMLR